MIPFHTLKAKTQKSLNQAPLQNAAEEVSSAGDSAESLEPAESESLEEAADLTDRQADISTEVDPGSQEGDQTFLPPGQGTPASLPGTPAPSSAPSPISKSPLPVLAGGSLMSGLPSSFSEGSFPVQPQPKSPPTAPSDGSGTSGSSGLTLTISETSQVSTPVVLFPAPSSKSPPPGDSQTLTAAGLVSQRSLEPPNSLSPQDSDDEESGVGRTSADAFILPKKRMGG